MAEVNEQTSDVKKDLDIAESQQSMEVDPGADTPSKECSDSTMSSPNTNNKKDTNDVDAEMCDNGDDKSEDCNQKQKDASDEAVEDKTIVLDEDSGHSDNNLDTDVGEVSVKDKNRLLEDPVDHEFEPTDLNLSQISDGEVKSGRIIKKPDAYSPDHDYNKKAKKKFGARGKRGRRKSGSLSTALPSVLSGENTTALDGLKNAGKSINQKWLEPFDHGWKRELVLRNTYNEGKSRPADVYYYTPDGGPKLRSCVEIVKHLEKIGSNLPIDCFTFVKESIHEGPSEIVRLAGKAKCGRSGKSPEQSPLKSPKIITLKSPLMKQKSPFTKSPLQIKKSAIGIANSSPTSPKHVNLPSLLKFTPAGNKTPVTHKTLDKVRLIVKTSVSKEGGKLLMDMTQLQKIKPIVTPGSVTNSPATSSTTHTPNLVSLMSKGVTKAVTKKQTGKRGRPSLDPTSTDQLAKKQRQESEFEGGQRLCGLSCPGRHGVPPSLHCTVCMCMFHPECVGKTGQQRLDGYVCKPCKTMNMNLSIADKAGAGASFSAHLLEPPPLRISGVTSMASKVGGPPPLRAAPGVSISPANMRHQQPPPLRMAPISGIPQTNNPTMILPFGINNMSDNTVASSIGFLPSLSMGLAAPLAQSNVPPLLTSTVISSNNGLISAPALLPSRESGVISQQISLPSILPNEISGQVLSLPGNVTNKLNINRPLSLLVNGQKYVIPTNCLLNTGEGLKVFLPPGSLPENMTKGPSSPININLNTELGQDQVLNIAPLGDTVPDSVTGPSKEPEQQKKASSERLQSAWRKMCHFQQLHVGVDCMLLIFQYLSITDLLHVATVCRTWQRISSQSCLWRSVKLRGTKVNNWEIAAKTLREHNSRVLDFRGLHHSENASHTWESFVKVLEPLKHLHQLDFGQCPANVLHAVADQLPDLTSLTAEFITDTTEEPDMWSKNVKLDVGKFAKLKELKMLRLRAVCGMVIPTFSFNGDLTELSALRKLRTLSLTTLRDVGEEDFSFLGALTDMEELELGDLTSWTEKTYSQLGSLVKLTTLRLECGTDFSEGGLGEAMEKLPNLKHLELIKFAVNRSLVKHLPKIKSLKTLSVWPDTESQAAVINTNTLCAVSEMTFLHQLDWGVMIDANSNVPPSALDDSSNDSSNSGSKEALKSQRDCIPLLPLDINLDDPHEESEIANLMEYLNINELVDRLCDYLPDTKIRVFKVPVLSTNKMKST